jgi:hypothetical protein
MPMDKSRVVFWQQKRLTVFKALIVVEFCPSGHAQTLAQNLLVHVV